MDGTLTPVRDTTHSAENIDNACTLCHGKMLAGVEGTNGGGADLSCQGYPPIDDSPSPPDLPIPVDHLGVADINLHVECLICHGMNESATGGSFEPATNYLLFDYTTDTNGDHWDGRIQMNLETQYNDTNFGCDAASCHGLIPNAPGFRLSDSGLPVILKPFFGSD